MVTYILISILIYIILIIVIVILSLFLKKKGQKVISEDNNKVKEQKIIEKRINNLTEDKKITMVEKIEKANNFNDYINIFTEL